MEIEVYVINKLNTKSYADIANLILLSNIINMVKICQLKKKKKKGLSPRQNKKSLKVLQIYLLFDTFSHLDIKCMAVVLNNINKNTLLLGDVML